MVVSTHEPVARVQCAECRSGSEKHEGDVSDDNFKGTSSFPRRRTSSKARRRVQNLLLLDAATEGKTVQLNAQGLDLL